MATNQILTDGRLSFTWAYLAFGFAVLASVFTAAAASQQEAGVTPVRRGLWGTRATYLRQLRASVSAMETIGVRTQGEFVLMMRQVYVDMLLRPRPPQNVAWMDGIGPQEDIQAKRRPLIGYLSDGGVFVVLGGPGSGKTTLLRHTVLTLCDQARYRARRPLPVLIYLRDHAASILGTDPPGLPTVAAGAGWLDGKIRGDWLRQCLDRQRCVVLLDGLDEVVGEQDRMRAVAWVRRQMERYPGNVWVLTSRPYGYLSNPLPNADVLQVERFSGRQISAFLHAWYYANESRARDESGQHVRELAARKADDLLAQVYGLPALYELGTNPLLLTMIANVHRYRSALPASRAELYAEMCDVLVHRRQQAKPLPDRTGLEGPKKEIVMRHLALHMMRRQVRAIPLAEVHEVVAEPLRLVTEEGRVTPQMFLDDVLQGGLIVEHEQEAYGFAHFTFQEYLAAALIRDQPGNFLELLRDGVDDLWWRETSLLWAALGDATPVIEACLDTGTTRALALAFDCADEARLIQPDTRARLNRLLLVPDGGHGGAQERHRLIAAVTASRSLRKVIWVGGTIPVCARPVTRALYHLFTLNEMAAGRQPPALDTTVGLDGDAPAVGMESGDVTRFLGWLNGLFDDGTEFRLATREELCHRDTELIACLKEHTVWTGPGPGLHQPDGVAWPYAPSAEQLARYPSIVRNYVELALRLTQATTNRTSLEPSHVLGYIHAFITQRTADGSNPSNLELVLNLDLARDLTRDLVLDLRLAVREGGQPTLDRARTVARDLDRALRYTLGLTLALDPVQDLTLTFDHFQALSRDLAQARELGVLDLDRVLDLVGDLDRELARALARALARTYDHVRGQSAELALDLERALTLTHARNADLGGDLARGLIRDLALSRTSVPGSDSSLDLARDLALDVGTYHRDLLTSAVTAFSCLSRCWAGASQGRRQPRAGHVRRSFEEFLAGLLADSAVRAPRPAADPAGNIRQALQALARGVPSPYEPDVRHLAEHALGLIGPVLERRAPMLPRVLTTAGVELLAALALLRHDSTPRPDVSAPLAEALFALITLADRRSAASNAVLLLVHA
ncbi:NACHT domain-containing protein [Nonomuraea sp. NPDC049400]|uniref:NACHT domain-containing protein n=1 Tax=Nonomuraea sp. NPDC049400 TaxID=3364352 RepID=UPI0037972B9F